MRVLSNRTRVRTKNVEFVSASRKTGERADIAVAVRGPGFFQTLLAAVEMGVPVIIVAGTEDSTGRECVRTAERYGVPPECVLLLRDGKVTDLSGNEVAPAVGRGISLGAVLRVAEYAIEKGLVPEPLVWADSVDGNSGNMEKATRELGQDNSAGPKKKRTDLQGGGIPQPDSAPAENAGEAENTLLSLLKRAEKVVAFFQSCPGADSSSVVAGMARTAGSSVLHLEINSTPVSYTYYGSSLEDAVSSGKYAFCDGRQVAEADNRKLYGLVMAEIRTPPCNPQVVDEVYRAAYRIVHVAGHRFRDAIESIHNVQKWLDSGMGLRLDGLVVDRVPKDSHVLELYLGNLGTRVRIITGIEGDEDFSRLAEIFCHS